MERFDCRQRSGDIALVLAASAAVTEEMLDRGEDVAVVEERRAALQPLQPLDHRLAQRGDQSRILRVTFIGPTPTRVGRDGDGGGEGPVDPGDRDLGRGRLANAADQFGIAGRAEPDIVREERRARDIVVTVDRVGRPQHWHHRFAIG